MLEENIKLSVIIPAYNEEKNISSTLLDIYSSLKDRGLVYASNQSLRPIFLLDTWLADNLEKSADDFRDSTVVLSEHQF